MIRERHKHSGTYRIPSIGGLKSIGAAARVRTRFNVLDAFVSGGVQPRIEVTNAG